MNTCDAQQKNSEGCIFYYANCACEYCRHQAVIMSVKMQKSKQEQEHLNDIVLEMREVEKLKEENEKLKAESTNLRSLLCCNEANWEEYRHVLKENEDLRVQLQNQKDCLEAFKESYSVIKTELSNLLGCDKDNISIYNSVLKLKAQLQELKQANSDLAGAAIAKPIGITTDGHYVYPFEQ